MRLRRADGRMGKLTLGNANQLTLAAARQMAMEVQNKRAQGVDPFLESIRKESLKKEKASNTFGSLSRQFIEQYARPKLRGWRDTAVLLGLRPFNEDSFETIPNSLADRWSNKPVADISPKDILAVMDEVRTKAVPGLMKQRRQPHSEGQSLALFARLSKFFSWCQGRLLLDRNPCAGLTRPTKPPARTRVLNDDEIRSFWRASEQVGEPYEQALKLLLLTGQRLDEIAAMRWDELDADRLTLNLPASRTKNKRPHFVPLGPIAQNLIGSVHKIAHCDYVFTTNGHRPLVNFSHVKTRLDAWMEPKEAWRLQDLRRTVASRLPETGTQQIVIEKLLNHASGLLAGVAGVYNRFDYAQERRAALELWEHKLNKIISS